MGIFFFVHSVALVEDLPLNETYATPQDLMKDMNDSYKQNAYNCWIASLMYLATLAFSLQQFYYANNNNSRRS